MQIDFIRHGATAGNLERRYVGTTDEPLTEEAGRKLFEIRDCYPEPGLVFASPLLRCVRTAEILFPETRLRTLDDLRECGFGEFEYKNYGELRNDPRYQAWIDSGGTTAFPGGESRADFCERCCAAFEEACAFAEKAGAEHIAFVVHGGTIMAILDRYSSPHRDYFDWQVKNGEGFSAQLRADEKAGSCFGRMGERLKQDSPFPGRILSDIRPLPAAPALTGVEDRFIIKKNKRLRCGYTTGSCAAAAAKAAVQMLLTGRLISRADLLTPKGVQLHLPVEGQQTGKGFALCSVRKYAGDDPDATDGTLICARVDYLDPVKIFGGGFRNPEFPNGEMQKQEVCEKRDFEKGNSGVQKDGAQAVSGVSVRDGAPSTLDCGGIEADGAASGLDPGGIEADGAPSALDLGGIEADGGFWLPVSSGGGMEREFCWTDSSRRIFLAGGEGVGRVTKPGLEQPVGAPAINRVPRAMIMRETAAVCEEQEFGGLLKITVSVPAGAAIARKTFNPHIGILGGISILGTSGIVTPMSEEALIASIRLEMQQKVTNGERYILITPGNYGADFIRRKEISDRLDAESSMKCSNYVGETLDMAAELGVKGILFVAHVGKFVKVSGGVMNTHSAHADCRAELMAAQALRAGAPPSLALRLLETNTTEEAVGLLKEAGCLKQTMEEMARRIHFYLQKHCLGALKTEVILYSNQYGYLGETEGAGEMLEEILLQQEKDSFG